MLQKWILKEAKSFIENILNKVSTNNLKFNRYICERFDKIAARMTKPTSTSDECVDALKFIENLKFVESFELKVSSFYLKKTNKYRLKNQPQYFIFI